METTTLVIFSSIISIIIGIPLGILMSKSTVAENIIKPILDFMQTMPGFVYLIPAVAFLVLVLYRCLCIRYLCFTPTVRMTNLGIRQVPKELVEAADSYGSTASQKLFKVEIPLLNQPLWQGLTKPLCCHFLW